MIRNTFSILQGIGEKKERRLWSEGVLTWEDFLNADTIGCISPARKNLCDVELCTAGDALTSLDGVYFHENVRRREHWRLFEDFRGRAVCLDIETNGFQTDAGGYTTMVGLYDGYEYRSFVRGRDLSAETLGEALSEYGYLITFFGSAFDVPFLMASLGMGPEFNMPHFDLCFGARKLGMKGGLKALETGLGMERPDEVKGMNGYDAVILWEQAKRGSGEALDLLVMYNREDTVNLMTLADEIYSRLRSATGIEEYL